MILKQNVKALSERCGKINPDRNLASLWPAREEETLYVDVTHTWGTELQTGIQRVVRQLVTSWYSSNTNIALIIFQEGKYKVLPSTALANFAVIYSARIPKGHDYKLRIFNRLRRYYLRIRRLINRRWIKILLEIPTFKFEQKFPRNHWAPKDSSIMNPTNAKILILDLVLDPNQIAYLKEISVNFGAEISFLSYDCNPLIAPQYWPEEVSEGFINYISLVSYSKRVWSISETAQDDIKKFSNADLDKISFDFKWLPPFDFPACAHNNPLVRGLEEEEFILMVASYVPSKNHLGFLRALQLLRARGIAIPKVYFVGGGSWIAPEIDSKILELSNLGIQVARYEGIENCCLGRFYENCRFSILPSFIEGFGLPIVESLSFGKPVVTSDSTSMGELLVLPGTIGFSHEQSPNLEEILERLILERELLETLTADARGMSGKLGTWQEYAADLYQFVMGNKQ